MRSVSVKLVAACGPGPAVVPTSGQVLPDGRTVHVVPVVRQRHPYGRFVQMSVASVVDLAMRGDLSVTAWRLLCVFCARLPTGDSANPGFVPCVQAGLAEELAVAPFSVAKAVRQLEAYGVITRGAVGRVRGVFVSPSFATRLDKRRLAFALRAERAAKSQSVAREAEPA